MFESAMKILRVEPGADPEILRKAYLRMVKRYPPEHFPDKFSKINRAYNQLRADDAVLKDLLSNVLLFKEDPSPFLGLLWGELPELREESHEVDFQGLLPLFEEKERKRALLEVFESAAKEELHLQKEVKTDYGK